MSYMDQLSNDAVDDMIGQLSTNAELPPWRFLFDPEVQPPHGFAEALAQVIREEEEGDVFEQHYRRVELQGVGPDAIVNTTEC